MSRYPTRRRASHRKTQLRAGSLDVRRGTSPSLAPGSGTSTNANGASTRASSSFVVNRPASRPPGHISALYGATSVVGYRFSGSVSVTLFFATSHLSVGSASAGAAAFGILSVGSPQTVKVHAARLLAPPSLAASPSRFA